MRGYDLISSTAWLLVGLGFVAGGFQLGFGRWAAPGPGFFPGLIGGVLGLLGLVLLLRTAVQRPISAGGGRTRFWKEKESWKAVLMSLLALIFYMLFLNPLGYLLTTFLFMGFLVKWVGKKGWALSLVLALLSSLVSYWLFHRWLEVSLPGGFLQ